MSIFEYGRAKRFPLAPPVSRMDAALAASPAQNVAHVRLHQLHGIVDGKAGGHATAGTIDVHLNIFIGIFLFQEQKLRDDQIGQIVVDRAADEDYPFL